MRKHTADNPAMEAQDWTKVRIKDMVMVVEPRGHAYTAVVENKTPDSSVIWIRRTDINTRHLIERHDGTRVQTRGRPSREEPLQRNLR